VSDVLDHVEKAAVIPLAGRKVPEFDSEELRETFFGRYRIPYRVRGTAVQVLFIFHGHREWPIKVRQRGTK
jgi:plasmid stabilization system protein ParE